MAMQTDVSSTYLAASGDVTAAPFRLKSFIVRGDGTAGYVKFRDGSVSGTVLLQVDLGTADTQTFSVLLPGEGIRFPTSIYADMSHAAALTSFCA